MKLPDEAAFWVKKALYNLNKDLYELNNLLVTENDAQKFSNKIEEPEACFQEWMERTGQIKN
jgi:hypothetical protein